MVVSGLTWLTILYLRAGVALFYLVVIIVEVLILAIPTLILGSSYTFHLHHCNVAMIFVSLLCYQDIVVTVFHGLATGAMIEGASSWGYALVWTPAS